MIITGVEVRGRGVVQVPHAFYHNSARSFVRFWRAWRTYARSTGACGWYARFERTISSEKDLNQGQVVVQGVYQSKCSSIKPIKVYFFSIVVVVLFFLVTVVEKCTFCLRQPSQFWKNPIDTTWPPWNGGKALYQPQSSLFSVVLAAVVA